MLQQQFPLSNKQIFPITSVVQHGTLQTTPFISKAAGLINDFAAPSLLSVPTWYRLTGVEQQCSRRNSTQAQALLKPHLGASAVSTQMQGVFIPQDPIILAVQDLSSLRTTQWHSFRVSRHACTAEIKLHKLLVNHYELVQSIAGKSNRPNNHRQVPCHTPTSCAFAARAISGVN